MSQFLVHSSTFPMPHLSLHSRKTIPPTHHTSMQQKFELTLFSVSFHSHKRSQLGYSVKTCHWNSLLAYSTKQTLYNKRDKHSKFPSPNLAVTNSNCWEICPHCSLTLIDIQTATQVLFSGSASSDQICIFPTQCHRARSCGPVGLHQSDQFLWKENGAIKLGLIMDTKEVNRRCKTKILAKNPLQNLIENHLYSNQHTWSLDSCM
jgi:hypothetical protein